VGLDPTPLVSLYEGEIWTQKETNSHTVAMKTELSQEMSTIAAKSRKLEPAWADSPSQPSPHLGLTASRAGRR
jgi:hypothetical protein